MVNLKSECIDPSQVKAFDKAAYSDGAGRTEFIQHLTECAYCQTETADYQRLLNLAEQQLHDTIVATHRLNCPSTDLITDYAFNFLEGSEKLAVMTHLETCEYCMAEYNLVARELKTEVTPLNRSLASPLSDFKQILQRVVAQLVPPTLNSGFAVRQGVAQERQPVEYQADDVSVLVQVQPERATYTISGMVNRAGFDLAGLADSPMRLYQATELVAEDVLDVGGNFYVERLKVAADQPLSLELEFSDKLIVISDLKLQD